MRRRRGLLAIGAALLAGLGACTTGRGGPRSVTFSLARLQATVAERFPQRYGAQGLIDLALLPPRLRLLPESNRLGAQIALQATGPLLARAYTGQADVDFGLRYEAGDHTLRATDLRVNALQLDDLPPRTAQTLQQAVAQWVRQSLREVAVYRLREQDLALADTLGLRPGPITVVPAGLRMELLPTGQ